MNVLSLFLVLDATTPAFILVESNANTASWSVFLSLGIAAATYVIGVLVISLGAFLRTKFGHRDEAALLALSACSPNLSEFVLAEYRQFAKRRQLLEGAFPTFAIAVPGLWLESLNFQVPILGWTLIVLALTCCAGALILAGACEHEYRRFLQSAQSDSRNF
ncbi:MAG: hypothetical protein ABJ007_22820, partial [Pseudophaeobacter sp.]|uniref:hypothetical protein n=1 Tax=Pseudophaeobacter sp. TaxID=1971739 RepID=UPI003296C250